MLLFLAPSLLLMPAQIVSATEEEVVQEVTATFNFTETEPGAWWPFTAGGGGIQPPGPCLEQYTRANVVRANTTLPGCQFRNYTTGSGSVAGDLAGTLSLAWNTFNFNQTYPYTPKYMSGNYFGFIMGRGHIDKGGGNNFTIAFVADFDANNATMGNAAGKGFLLSANETGNFTGHKIIGDFNFTKTGSSWSGTFNLRNYAPNEVYDLGWLNVSGGVLQETTDHISTPLALVNFIADGSYVTPTNLTTDFEEIAWGRDPIKTVTSGHLGVNGTMDLSRDTALYLEVNASASWVRIQGTTACNLFINDTYAVTGDDGSPYGKLYELLLLYIPDQQLGLGEFFEQNGYTITPFGMLNPSTDCYAGTESFAFAHVAIESSVGTATQWSTDVSYGLYPHPKVSNNTITPNKGSPGATISAVTITGNYFIRAAGKKSGWVNNSGSVDFGPGITVNSYTVDSAKQITANITIAPDATIGKRNVTVTSCFGFSNGSGAAPYKTGTLVDGFEVVGAGASLDGHVNLQGFPATNITVRFFSPGTHTEAMKKYGTTDASGNFTISGLSNGTYDVAVKGQSSLSNLVTGVNLTVPGRIDFGVLLEGDVNNDDYIDGSDYGPLSSAWLSYPGQLNWDPAVDFSRDNYIDGSDYGPLSANWLLWGGTFGWPGNWN
jgi:hypothetical protein